MIHGLLYMRSESSEYLSLSYICKHIHWDTDFVFSLGTGLYHFDCQCRQKSQNWCSVTYFTVEIKKVKAIVIFLR